MKVFHSPSPACRWTREPFTNRCVAGLAPGARRSDGNQRFAGERRGASACDAEKQRLGTGNAPFFGGWGQFALASSGRRI